MITDEEIEIIFKWANRNKIRGKRLQTQTKWGINIDEKEFQKNEFSNIRIGIPRDKELLKKITHLNLEYNRLSSIPKELCKLEQLTHLNLYGNYIGQLPKEIGKLKNLKYLNIGNNNLKALPKEIGSLNNLEYLQINSNYKLNNLPEEIGNLENLIYLNLNFCKLKALPKEIGNLKKLKYLYLYYNSLIQLPKEIGNLSNLKELDLRDSELKELPYELSNLINLEKFNGEPYIRLKCSKNETIFSKSLDKLKVIIKEKNYSNNFPYKNLLLKGVPGTGKSRAIENIINNELKLKNHKENILRINIHSASSNSDLMQGIGISSKDGQIEYKEKEGLILNFIKKATFNPNQPFVLILEEIQENSLNELIGDLIYLIEDEKRTKNIIINDDKISYQELVESIIARNPDTYYIEIPYLVENSTEYRKIIMPDNLYIFCTSNYRDDKKIMEDNLLRRFEVLEIYPKVDVVHNYCKDFFRQINENILDVLQDEIHPDRFLIGHANWLNVTDEKELYRAFLKVVVEFKDIKEIDFSDFKQIAQNLPIVKGLNFTSYKSLIEDLQNKIGYRFLD